MSNSDLDKVNIVPKPHSQGRQINQAKFDEREAWYKLVVKIITWKDSSLPEKNITPDQKISSIEWKTYYERMIKINTSSSRDKIITQLEKTRSMIQKSGGFSK